MNKRAWARCAFSVAMSFLLSVSGIACLLTAFEVECSIGRVLFWAMAWAVVWSVSYTLSMPLIPMSAFALAVGYLWRSGILQESVHGLLLSLSTVYNRFNGWPLMGAEGSADCILCILSICGSMNTAQTICKRRSSLITLFFAAIPLLPCFLTAGAVPQPMWLGVWLFGVTLLLLTQPVRRQAAAGKLTAVLLLPVAALSVALIITLPQSKQEKPRDFARQAVQLLQEMGIGLPSGRPLKVDGGAVELRKLGPREEASYPVMTVTSERGGVVYLRGCAYDTYFQNNWTNLNLREELYWPKSLEPAGTVTVKTEYVLSMRYFPYYGDGLGDVSRGINNFSKLTEYSYAVGVLTALPDTYTYTPDHGYTQLPTVAQRWAQSVLKELIGPDMTDAQKIAAITAYVKGLAKYSLYAQKMPEGAADFVVWFAEEADKGYCVHFATAGAVLLRAAGIPTRFVTGYMVQTEAGKETQVYGKDAHAWVECFLEGIGWVPVEATPGAEPEQVTVPEKESPKKLDYTPVLYGGAALMAALTGFVLIRWAVRVLRRRSRRKRGTDCERLLATYSQLEELLALDGQKPPEELRVLAQRAKFSNHPVEPGSLERMENAFKNAKKQLKKHSFARKFHYRLILNLY